MVVASCSCGKRWVTALVDWGAYVRWNVAAMIQHWRDGHEVRGHPGALGAIRRAATQLAVAGYDPATGRFC